MLELPTPVAGLTPVTDVRGRRGWKHAFKRSKKLLDTNSTELVTYGPSEVKRAVQWGAVEALLCAGKVNKSLAAAVVKAGGEVYEVNMTIDLEAHQFISLFTGLLAVLRFPIPDHDAPAAVTSITPSPPPPPSPTTTTATATTTTFTTPKKAKHTGSLLTAILKINGSTTFTNTTNTMVDDADEAEEEFEALAAIFPPLGADADADGEVAGGTEFLRVGTSRTCLIATHAVPTDGSRGGWGGCIAHNPTDIAVCLRIILPQAYPEAAAEIVLEAHRGLDATAAGTVLAAAVAACQAEADACGPALFAIATATEEAIEAVAAAPAAAKASAGAAHAA
jgi:hypothetical protein